MQSHYSSGLAPIRTLETLLPPPRTIFINTRTSLNRIALFYHSTDQIHVSGDHQYRIQSLSLALASYHKAYFTNLWTNILCPSTTLFTHYHTKATRSTDPLIIFDSPSQSKPLTPHGKYASPASTPYRPSGFRTPCFESSSKQRGHSKTQPHSSTSG